MNAKSILKSKYHTRSSQRLKTQEIGIKIDQIEKQKERAAKNTQYHEKGFKIILNNQNSPNLNTDYFYSHTDEIQCLRFVDDKFESTERTASEQRSNTGSTQQLSQPQIEEFKIFNELNTKIHQLQGNFAKTQSKYLQKIAELTNRLKAKTQQNQQLNHVLKQLSIQQRSMNLQVDLLMQLLKGGQMDSPKKILVHKQNQARQSPSNLQILPLSNKGEQNYCEKSKGRTIKKRASQILFKGTREKTQLKIKGIVKSQQIGQKTKTRPVFGGTTLEKIVENMSASND